MLSILFAVASLFHLEGRIDTLCRNRLNLLVNNAIVRIQITEEMRQSLHEGDRVRVIGKRKPESKTMRFVYHTAESVETIQSLPQIKYTPKVITENADEVRLQPQWTPVLLSGVVESARESTDAEWSWLVIRCKIGTIGAAARTSEYPLSWLKTLVDAEISLSGLVTRSWGSENSLSSHLSVRGTNSIKVIKPAPSDPFSAALAYHDVDAPHRQLICGTVIAAGRDRFALMSHSGTLLTVFPCDGQPSPRPFQKATAVGFTSAIPNLALKNALVRIEDDVQQYDVDGGKHDVIINRVPDSPLDQNQLVRLSGTITGMAIDTDGKIFVSTERRTVSIDISSLSESEFSPPDIGSVIEATGIAFLDLAPPSPAESFTQILGITIVPRFPSDIVVISTPPWWTPTKFVILLSFILAISAASIVIVHVRNRRRTLFEKCLAEVKVKERTHLAVELHDSFSQTLTGVQMELQAAVRKLDKKHAALFDTSRQMLCSCHRELRNSLWDLRSRTFEELDMTEAVSRTIAPHLGKTKALIRFNVKRDALSDTSAHTLLRTVRELVVNAVRHGNAHEIRIAGALNGGRLMFSVCDDGHGFDPNTCPGADNGHFGLSGIRERINEMNGTMEIQSAPNAGTRIAISFDVCNEENT